MKVQNLKSELLQEIAQYIETDESSTVLFSDDTIFNCNNLNDNSIFSLSPFIESIWDSVLKLEKDQDISFPCMQIEFEGQNLIADFHFYKPDIGKVIILIFDLTRQYQGLQNLLQAKNQSEINAQLLSAEKENLKLQNELVSFKNKQLEQLQSFKDLFLANMSHELRTPLNAVIGFSQLLREETPSIAQKKYLDIILDSSSQLMNIINDILDLSKIESGKLKIEEISFNLNQALNIIADSYEAQAKKKEIGFDYSIDSSIPMNVKSDPVRIKQIANNLLSNALKFTHHGSVKFQVDLMSQTESDIQIKMKVKDTGIGMNKDQLDQVFDNFVQASDQTTRQYGGTGLGLSIVKNLVKLMGGEIKVSSGPNKGTEFEVILSFAKSEKQISSNTSPNKIDGTGLNILITDDAEFNLLLAKTILEKSGFKIDLAINGEEALELVQLNSYDLLLLDMHMPVMDGFQVLKKIHELNLSVPVVAMTALAFTDEKNKIMALGADGYISKPINKNRLLQVIGDLLNLDVSKAKNIQIDKKKDPYLDLTNIKTTMDGDKKQINELLKIFARQSEKLLSDLNSTVQHENYTLIPGMMHKLLNGVRMFGITSIEQKVEALSNQKSIDINESRLDLEFIKEVLKSTIEEIRRVRS